MMHSDGIVQVLADDCGGRRRAVDHVRRLHPGGLHRYYEGDRQIEMGVGSVVP
jgi:hypothetical protein